jgi:hypothetical protein
MKKLRPLAALAMVALIAAGCSNAAGEDGPTATGTKTSATRTPAMKFAACMRDNGVSAFPDPDASGELTIDGVLNGSSLDPDAPAWKQAIKACKDLQPSGFTGHKRSTQEQKPALKFAQCIRDNGVTDFPDPTPDSPLVDTNRIPSSATSGGMAMLNAAMKKCGELLADALDGR